MKADWDKLGKKWGKSDNVMIVDVDCTADGKDTCQKMGVRGYPTVKYFMAGKKKGKDYKGGRDFSSLDSFVKSTLDKAVKVCDPTTGKDCKPVELKFIEKHKGKNADELKAALQERADKFKEVRKQHFEDVRECKRKEKAFKKATDAHKLGNNILKAMQKAAKSKPSHDEL